VASAPRPDAAWLLREITKRDGFDTLWDAERKGASIPGNQAAMIASRNVFIAADRGLCAVIRRGVPTLIGALNF
jgi:hypothetical protein